MVDPVNSDRDLGDMSSTLEVFRSEKLNEGAPLATGIRRSFLHNLSEDEENRDDTNGNNNDHFSTCSSSNGDYNEEVAAEQRDVYASTPPQTSPSFSNHEIIEEQSTRSDDIVENYITDSNGKETALVAEPALHSSSSVPQSRREEADTTDDTLLESNDIENFMFELSDDESYDDSFVDVKENEVEKDLVGEEKAMHSDITEVPDEEGGKDLVAVEEEVPSNENAEVQEEADNDFVGKEEKPKSYEQPITTPGISLKQSSSILEMKNILTKYTESKGNPVDVSSHEAEVVKRPSLNLVNFLPSDEAVDPFLDVIQEADDEETTEKQDESQALSNAVNITPLPSLEEMSKHEDEGADVGVATENQEESQVMSEDISQHDVVEITGNSAYNATDDTPETEDLIQFSSHEHPCNSDEMGTTSLSENEEVPAASDARGNDNLHEDEISIDLIASAEKLNSDCIMTEGPHSPKSPQITSHSYLDACGVTPLECCITLNQGEEEVSVSIPDEVQTTPNFSQQPQVSSISGDPFQDDRNPFGSTESFTLHDAEQDMPFTQSQLTHEGSADEDVDKAGGCAALADADDEPAEVVVVQSEGTCEPSSDDDDDETTMIKNASILVIADTDDDPIKLMEVEESGISNSVQLLPTESADTVSNHTTTTELALGSGKNMIEADGAKDPNVGVTHIPEEVSNAYEEGDVDKEVATTSSATTITSHLKLHVEQSLESVLSPDEVGEGGLDVNRDSNKSLDPFGTDNTLVHTEIMEEIDPLHNPIEGDDSSLDTDNEVRNERRNNIESVERKDSDVSDFAESEIFEPIAEDNVPEMKAADILNAEDLEHSGPGIGIVDTSTKNAVAATEEEEEPDVEVEESQASLSYDAFKNTYSATETGRNDDEASLASSKNSVQSESSDLVITPNNVESDDHLDAKVTNPFEEMPLTEEANASLIPFIASETAEDVGEKRTLSQKLPQEEVEEYLENSKHEHTVPVEDNPDTTSSQKLNEELYSGRTVEREELILRLDSSSSESIDDCGEEVERKVNQDNDLNNVTNIGSEVPYDPTQVSDEQILYDNEGDVKQSYSSESGFSSVDLSEPNEIQQEELKPTSSGDSQSGSTVDSQNGTTKTRKFRSFLSKAFKRRRKKRKDTETRDGYLTPEEAAEKAREIMRHAQEEDTLSRQLSTSEDDSKLLEEQRDEVMTDQELKTDFKESGGSSVLENAPDATENSTSFENSEVKEDTVGVVMGSSEISSPVEKDDFLMQNPFQDDLLTNPFMEENDHDVHSGSISFGYSKSKAVDEKHLSESDYFNNSKEPSSSDRLVSYNLFEDVTGPGGNSGDEDSQNEVMDSTNSPPTKDLKEALQESHALNDDVMDPVATPVEHESDAIQQATSEEDEQVRDGNAIISQVLQDDRNIRISGQNGNVEIKESEDELSKNGSIIEIEDEVKPEQIQNQPEDSVVREVESNREEQSDKGSVVAIDILPEGSASCEEGNDDMPSSIKSGDDNDISAAPISARDEHMSQHDDMDESHRSIQGEEDNLTRDGKKYHGLQQESLQESTDAFTEDNAVSAANNLGDVKSDNAESFRVNEEVADDGGDTALASQPEPEPEQDVLEKDDSTDNPLSYDLKEETSSLGKALDDILDESEKFSAEFSYDEGVEEAESKPDSSISQVLASTSSISSTSSGFPQSQNRASSNSSKYDTDRGGFGVENYRGFGSRVEIEMPETIGHQLNSTSQRRLKQSQPPLQNPGQRLYEKGVESERKKAVHMKRIIQESQQGKRLNLATRSYSAPRPQSDGYKASVYSRLYAISKEKSDYSKPPKNISTRALAPSRAKSRLGTRGQPVHERLYNLAKNKIDRVKEKSNLHAQSRAQTLSSPKPESTSERLYNLAKRKRLIEDERRRLKKEQDEIVDLKPKTLELATRGSYTPLKERSYPGGNGSIHTRLFNLAKAKKDLLDHQDHRRKQLSSTKASSTRTPSNPKQIAKGVERLYGRSYSMQLEGQKRREAIAAKNNKRAPTPSRKIPVDKATGIYERGMMMKLNLEVKREDEGHMPYVSPLLNPLVADDDEDYVITTRARRSFSQSRSRSRTPLQRGRSSTPMTRSPSRGFSSSPRVTPRTRSRTPICSRTPPPPQTDGVRSGSRIRTRSRLRAPISGTTGATSFRSPSPKVIRSSPMSTSDPWRVSGPNVRDRSQTPQRAIRQSSMKEMLRKMESDVVFYSTVKKAIHHKEHLDQMRANNFQDEEDYHDSQDSVVSATSKGGRSTGSEILQQLADMSKSVEALDAFDGHEINPSSSSPPRKDKDTQSMKTDNLTLKTTDMESDASAATGSYNASFYKDELMSSQRYLVRPRSVDYCD